MRRGRAQLGQQNHFHAADLIIGQLGKLSCSALVFAFSVRSPMMVRRWEVCRWRPTTCTVPGSGRVLSFGSALCLVSLVRPLCECGLLHAAAGRLLSSGPLLQVHA